MIKDIVKKYYGEEDIFKPFNNFNSLLVVSPKFEELRTEAIERNIFSEAEIDNSPLPFYITYTLLKHNKLEEKKGYNLASYFAEMIYFTAFDINKKVEVNILSAQSIMETMVLANKLGIERYYFDFMLDYGIYDIFLLKCINKDRLEQIINNSNITPELLRSKIDILTMSEEEFSDFLDEREHKALNNKNVHIEDTLTIVVGKMVYDNNKYILDLKSNSHLNLKGIGTISWDSIEDVFVIIEVINSVIYIRRLEGVTVEFEDKANVYLSRHSTNKKSVIKDSKITIINRVLYGIDQLYDFENCVLGVDLNGETYLDIPEDKNVEIIDHLIPLETIMKITPDIYRKE